MKSGLPCGMKSSTLELQQQGIVTRMIRCCDRVYHNTADTNGHVQGNPVCWTLLGFELISDPGRRTCTGSLSTEESKFITKKSR
ncbi:hypothetical protein TNCV_1618131 [Trichonephila clavipes]|nr:hypothetical protein TNCV_1618131 [Trichonephila clavipes]